MIMASRVKCSEINTRYDRNIRRVHKLIDVFSNTEINADQYLQRLNAAYIQYAQNPLFYKSSGTQSP